MASPTQVRSARPTGRSCRDSRPLSTPEIEPLQHKVMLTYAEAAALGFGSIDTLRDKVAAGDLVKSVVKVGFGKKRQHVRFVREELIRELRECS